MLKINEKYYLDTDACNYILLERSIVKDKKSKNYGKETFKNIAYYGNLETLYKGIIEKEIKGNIELLNNIKKVIELKNSLLLENID